MAHGRRSSLKILRVQLPSFLAWLRLFRLNRFCSYSFFLLLPFASTPHPRCRDDRRDSALLSNFFFREASVLSQDPRDRRASAVGHDGLARGGGSSRGGTRVLREPSRQRERRVQHHRVLDPLDGRGNRSPFGLEERGNRCSDRLLVLLLKPSQRCYLCLR